MNRLLLGVIVLVSLTWIGFSTFELVFNVSSLRPEVVFQEQDNELLIIHRYDEFQGFNDSSLRIPSELLVFFENPAFIEVLGSSTLFLSKGSNKLLLQSAGLWNHEKINKVFSAFAPKKRTKHQYDLNTSWKLEFKNNYCLLYKTAVPFERGEELRLPRWDSQASVSRILLGKTKSVEDIYLKAQGTVTYKHHLRSVTALPKVDDYSLFADIVPSTVVDYHFLEKRYALSSGELPQDSPLNQWCDQGFVTFTYRNTFCLVSDYKANQDPIATLNERLQRNENTLGNYFSGVQLTKNFPNERGFYLHYVGDKVVLSSKKEICEQLIADQQLGKTLVLSDERKNLLFGNSPRKVNERKWKEGQVHTLTQQDQQLFKTSFSYAVSAIPSEELNAIEESTTFALEAPLQKIIGSSATQFLVDKSNTLYAVRNGKLIWKKNGDGASLIAIKSVELNATHFILLTTSKGVYVYNAAGEEQFGGPYLPASGLSVEAQLYSWKGNSFLMVLDASGELRHLDSKGKLLWKLATGLKSPTLTPSIFVQNGKVIALISNAKESATIHLDGKKLLKKRPALQEALYYAKTANGPVYFLQHDNFISSFNYEGTLTKLLRFGSISSSAKYDHPERQLLAFTSQQNVVVLTETGLPFTQWKAPINTIGAIDVLVTRNGKTLIALLDGLSNDIYVFDKQGRQLHTKAFEGKTVVKLSEVNGTYFLTSDGNGFVVRYHLTLDE